MQWSHNFQNNMDNGRGGTTAPVLFLCKRNTLYKGVIFVFQIKPKGTAKAVPIGLATGALVSIVVTFVGSAALSWLVLSEKVGEQGIGYGSMSILLIAAILGAWTAVASIQKQRLQMCVLSGLIYYLLLLAITALFFGGQYTGMWVTALVILIGVLIVAFFPNKSGKMKFRKRPYR